jgi:hypothetical protein
LAGNLTALLNARCTVRFSIRSVAVTPDELVVTLADGRKIATPLAWYPRLRDASAAARGNFELTAMGVHWPDLDEDLGIARMLRGRPAI